MRVGDAPLSAGDLRPRATISMDRAVFPQRWAWSLAVLGGLIAVAACEEGENPLAPDPLPPGIAVLAIVPPSDTLYSIADTVHFRVVTFDQAGVEVASNGVLWRSSDPNVVRIEEGGLAISKSNGAVTINATLGLASDSAAIVVAQRAERVEAALAADTLDAIGDTARASATAYDAKGFVLGKGVVAWASSDKSVALVSRSGVVTGVGDGTAFITATAGSASKMKFT